MNVLTLLGILSSPVALVLGAIAKGFFDRRTNKDTTKVAKQAGHTGEMEVAFDGLTANLNSLQEQLKDVKAELKESKADARRTSDDLHTTRSDLRALESVVSDLRVERSAFLIHISTLEALIPIPPGPPPRPSWMIPEYHSKPPDAP